MLANSKKRVLSLFLAFVMVFGLLPTAAFAAANDGQIGKYVELNADDTIQAGTETATHKDDPGSQRIRDHEQGHYRD